jgi:cyclohexadienyl dehydratase
MTIISKLAGMIAGLVAICLAVSPPAQADSRLQKILESGVIKVGTTGDFNPMTIRDVASGEYKGFEIDAANRLAKDLGVKVEFVATDWKTMVAGVLSDKYDIVMSGTSIDVGRAKVVGYTMPYVYVGTVPMTLKTNAGRFKTWDDANKPGVKVSVILGTIFEQQAREAFPNATIVTVEAPATGYQEVLAGRADVTISSNVDAASIAQRFEAMQQFGGEVRNRRPLGYITAQDDFVFINFLNAWLAINEANGFFKDLSSRWGL